MEPVAMRQGPMEGAFFQITLRSSTMYLTRRVDIFAEGIKIYGPEIVTLTLVPDEQTKRMVLQQNADVVLERFVPWALVGYVDQLDPARLDKNVQKIYARLSGVHLA